MVTKGNETDKRLITTNNRVAAAGKKMNIFMCFKPRERNVYNELDIYPLECCMYDRSGQVSFSIGG